MMMNTMSTSCGVMLVRPAAPRARIGRKAAPPTTTEGGDDHHHVGAQRRAVQGRSDRAAHGIQRRKHAVVQSSVP